MTVFAKSKGTTKELVETNKFKRYGYDGQNTHVAYKAEWVDLTVNSNVVLPGGEELTKIGQLPTNCSHPATPIGVFSLMTSAWMPANKDVYVTLAADGSIKARSQEACNGVLYFHWFTTEMSVNVGGGVLNLFRNLGLLLKGLVLA